MFSSCFIATYKTQSFVEHSTSTVAFRSSQSRWKCHNHVSLQILHTYIHNYVYAFWHIWFVLVSFHGMNAGVKKKKRKKERGICMTWLPLVKSLNHNLLQLHFNRCHLCTASVFMHTEKPLYCRHHWEKKKSVLIREVTLFQRLVYTKSMLLGPRPD